VSLKTVILAGGFGTRLSEETTVRPKPMVEIGERPILWHIMKGYEAHGVTEFVICCGYKSHVIKDYFANYAMRAGDVTIDLAGNELQLEAKGVEPWRVHLIETGDATMTGGRLKRVEHLVSDDTFFFTYGDCVTNLDMTKLLEFHRSEDALATLTAIRPPGRFGALTLDDHANKISQFREKPEGDGGWVNGGFFVLEPDVFETIGGDDTIWEREPLEQLAHAGRLAAYRHHGYWQNMDSLRDKMVLEEQWAPGSPPWKTW
jgi:glucose-1-phosphate cytidylyltransferase